MWGSATLTKAKLQNEFKTISCKTGIQIELQGKSPKKFVIIDHYSDKDLLIVRNRFDSKITEI